ncbi:hypothetical protein ACFSR9_12820 [Deinococcus taklimakanensis]|uniref:DUF4131 domain-containing protein n=1 Tax=Deinococcus taklimakanensis TaxID=536443 RepID=A0ABW5P501_9DEIO
MALLPLGYLVLTLAFTAVLALLLRRPGAARPGVIWGLAAGLPVLAALTAALDGQARAARVLESYVPAPVNVTVTNGRRTQALQLDARDAACVERARRLHSEVELRTPGQPVQFLNSSVVTGALPDPRFVQALTLRGELECPNLRALEVRAK